MLVYYLLYVFFLTCLTQTSVSRAESYEAEGCEARYTYYYHLKEPNNHMPLMHITHMKNEALSALEAINPDATRSDDSFHAMSIRYASESTDLNANHTDTIVYHNAWTLENEAPFGTVTPNVSAQYYHVVLDAPDGELFSSSLIVKDHDNHGDNKIHKALYSKKHPYAITSARGKFEGASYLSIDPHNTMNDRQPRTIKIWFCEASDPTPSHWIVLIILGLGFSLVSLIMNLVIFKKVKDLSQESCDNNHI